MPSIEALDGLRVPCYLVSIQLPQPQSYNGNRLRYIATLPWVKPVDTATECRNLGYSLVGKNPLIELTINRVINMAPQEGKGVRR